MDTVIKVDTTSISEAKEACRKEARAILDGLTDDYMSEAGAKIAVNLLSMKAVRKAKTVLAYFSVGKEPGTLAIISKLLEEGKKVCLPLCTDFDDAGNKIDTADAMEARLITDFDDLEKGAYGIPEPKEYTKKIEPKKIDLVILPCVACDVNCGRLGHGAGYYDKYLSNLHRKCTKVALCYDKLIMQEIPMAGHDMRVDAVVTESTVHRWQD